MLIRWSKYAFKLSKIGPVGAFRAIKIAEKFSSDVQKLF